MIEIIDDRIKKTFNYKDEDNQTFLKNEVFWLNYLKSKWVPKLLEVGSNYVITRYYGNDLIKQKYMPDKQQVIDMFKFFKEKNVFKLNNALSNMTMNGKQLVAFDWKWARFRTDKYKDFEVMSYNKWISKIDSDLVEELKCMI
tara:strand:+ start:262 stop:690 length:429 start_codon:yes stop_codon:yes gene_type:complete